MDAESKLMNDHKPQPTIEIGHVNGFVSFHSKLDKKKSENILKRYAHQQAIVAALGQKALKGVDVSTLMEDALMLLVDGLHVNFGSIWELNLSKRNLSMRTGIGWKKQPQVDTLELDPNYPDVLAINLQLPSIFNELDLSSRVSLSDLLKSHQIVSGMSVAIQGSDVPFGTIGVYQDQPREFSREEVNFLQSVANVLGMAIERKRIEDQLVRSHSQLEIIIRNVADAILVQGNDGSMIFVNDVGVRMCGYRSAKELLKHSWEEILSNFEIYDEFKHPLPSSQLPGRQAVREEKDLQMVINLRNKLTGKNYWVITKSRPVYDEKGQVMMVVNIITDITEEKLVELEQLRLAAIVESTDDAVFSKDLNGLITSWNTGAEKLYGYSPKEIIGKPVTILFPPEKLPEFSSIMEVIRLGESVDHLETVRLRKDGRMVDIAVTISPLKDQTGTIIGASTIARDISLNKELERRKDAFINMASHELKTPITSMKAFAQVVQKRLENNSDQQSKMFLNKLDNQINRLADLVNDLLDLSKIEAGKLELNKEIFDICELVKEITYEVQSIYPEHQIEIEGTLNSQIIGDKDRIGQVLINLLTNAIKYSPGKDKVVVKISSDEHKANISVRDFGIGIEKDHVEKIFDRFFRAQGANEKTFPGLGIGLYISAELVKRHGGHIWVESVKGQGSTFHLTLPLQ